MGTPEALGASTKRFWSVTFIGLKAKRTNNTTRVWVQDRLGDAEFGIPLLPGQSITFTAPRGRFFTADQFVIDVETAGDGVVALLTEHK